MKAKLTKRDRINLSLEENFQFIEGFIHMAEEISMENDNDLNYKDGHIYYEGSFKDANVYFLNKNKYIIENFNKSILLKEVSLDDLNIGPLKTSAFLLIDFDILNFESNNPLVNKLKEIDLSLFSGLIKIVFCYHKEDWNDFEESLKFNIHLHIKDKYFNFFDIVSRNVYNSLNCCLFNHYATAKKSEQLSLTEEHLIKSNLAIIEMLEY